MASMIDLMRKISALVETTGCTRHKRHQSASPAEYFFRLAYCSSVTCDKHEEGEEDEVEGKSLESENLS